jgi:hypothetical protein
MVLQCDDTGDEEGVDLRMCEFEDVQMTYAV